MLVYGCVAGAVEPDDDASRVQCVQLTDSVLTANLYHGWDTITALCGYLPRDQESAGWAAVIQWVTSDSPPPAAFDLARVSSKA